jgi:DNA-binding HxlR family transcriptional regulator
MEAVAAPETHEGHGPSPYCPFFQAAIELIGKRWNGAIVRSMLSGSVRFSDFLGQIPGLSDRLLSERLRELEAAEIVERTVIPEIPVRVEYRLTAKGRELDAIVQAISSWGERWAGSECPSEESFSVPAKG